MWAIAKKDFKSFFFSPIGYIVVSIFLIIFAVIMYLLTVSNRSLDFSIVYNSMAWYALPLVMAVLTMRSFSEEKNKGTDKLLLASSKSVLSIVMGKILAIVMVIIVSVLLSTFYYFLFIKYGQINFRILMLTLSGFLLLSLAYASFGVLISSLTESQVISAIVTLTFLILPNFFSYGDGPFAYLSLIDFFGKFALGLISIKSIIAMVSFSVTCVILTVLEVNRKRKLD